MHIFIPGWKYYDFLITQLKNFLVLIVSFAASGSYWGFLTTRVREKTNVILQHCLDYCFFLIFNLLNLNFWQTFETTAREIRKNGIWHRNLNLNTEFEIGFYNYPRFFKFKHFLHSIINQILCFVYSFSNQAVRCADTFVDYLKEKPVWITVTVHHFKKFQVKVWQFTTKPTKWISGFSEVVYKFASLKVLTLKSSPLLLSKARLFLLPYNSSTSENLAKERKH